MTQTGKEHREVDAEQSLPIRSPHAYFVTHGLHLPLKDVANRTDWYDITTISLRPWGENLTTSHYVPCLCKRDKRCVGSPGIQTAGMPQAHRGRWASRGLTPSQQRAAAAKLAHGDEHHLRPLPVLGQLADGAGKDAARGCRTYWPGPARRRPAGRRCLDRWPTRYPRPRRPRTRQWPSGRRRRSSIVARGKQRK